MANPALRSVNAVGHSLFGTNVCGANRDATREVHDPA